MFCIKHTNLMYLWFAEYRAVMVQKPPIEGWDLRTHNVNNWSWTIITGQFILNPLLKSNNLSFDLGWPWEPSTKVSHHCCPSTQYRTSVLFSGAFRMCKVAFFERSRWCSGHETALRQTLIDQHRLSAGDSCLSHLLSNSPQTRCLKIF